MNMFLWNNNNAAPFAINEPAEIAQVITDVGTADFGAPIPGPTEEAIV